MKDKIKDISEKYNDLDSCPLCGNIMDAGDDICDDCLFRDAEGYGTLEQRFGLLYEEEN